MFLRFVLFGDDVVYPKLVVQGFVDGVYFQPFQIKLFGTISVDDVDFLQFQFILLRTTNNAGGELCFLLLHIRMHNMILS